MAEKRVTVPEEVSPLAQNYLLTIYMMKEDEGDPVTMSRLAEKLASSPATEHLGTSLASVAGMIRRMKRDGLLQVQPSKEIDFTSLGAVYAEAVMRRHQLAERLLADILGLELSKVHAEAHRLEHAISGDVEAKMVERLGNPQTCPYGHPIPGSGYQVPETVRPLSKAPLHAPMVVERIPEDDPRLIQYLVAEGVVPGQRLSVEEVAPYKGTVTLKVGGREVVVGVHVAPHILLRPAE